MQSAKETVKEILDNLPQDATYEDIVYEIYVKKNIEISKEQLKNGEIISEEQMNHRFEKWLK